MFWSKKRIKTWKILIEVRIFNFDNRTKDVFYLQNTHRNVAECRGGLQVCTVCNDRIKFNESSFKKPARVWPDTPGLMLERTWLYDGSAFAHACRTWRSLWKFLSCKSCNLSKSLILFEIRDLRSLITIPLKIEIKLFD